MAAVTLMKVRNPGEPLVPSQTQPFRGGASFLLRVQSAPPGAGQEFSQRPGRKKPSSRKVKSFGVHESADGCP